MTEPPYKHLRPRRESHDGDLAEARPTCQCRWRSAQRSSRGRHDGWHGHHWQPGQDRGARADGLDFAASGSPGRGFPRSVDVLPLCLRTRAGDADAPPRHVGAFTLAHRPTARAERALVNNLDRVGHLILSVWCPPEPTILLPVASTSRAPGPADDRDRPHRTPPNSRSRQV